jgi:hypothetical protein
VDVGNLTYRSFRPLLERAGLPKIRVHDLRHTFATLLLSKGTHPKIVQEMLGHANISMTLDTYSHVMPTTQDEAIAALEGALTWSNLQRYWAMLHYRSTKGYSEELSKKIGEDFEKEMPSSETSAPSAGRFRGQALHRLVSRRVSPRPEGAPQLKTEAGRKR